MASRAKKIGGDWVETTDPNSGKTYYANIVTKETSWTFPAELGAAAAKEAADSKPQVSKEEIWVERQDPKSGKTYYYNATTKERSWNRPQAATVVANDKDSANSKEDDAAAWLERTDPASGRTYYYHKVTKERRWVKPGQASADAPAPAAAAAASATAEEKRDRAPTSLHQEPPEPMVRGVHGRASIRMGDTTEHIRMAARSIARYDEARPSNLGANKTITEEVVGGGEEAAPAANDRFAKLRALAQNKGLASSSPVVDEEHPEPKSAQTDKDDDELELEKLAAELALGVPHFSMEEYVKANFNMQRKGIFGKQTTVEKVLNWKDEMIRKPLHKMPDRAMESECVQAFKNILSYMGQRNSSKDDIGHATKLLHNSVHAPEVFRDEIFCQIVKQTRSNPDAESTVKGWQLMSIVAGTFPPSKKLEKYLLSYCDQNTKDVLQDGTKVHPGVKPYAKYTMMRIRKSTSLGPRKEVPTAMEIQAARERQPVVIRVHLLDGHYKTVPAECWTTVRELNAMVAKKLKIQDATPFATFEVSSSDEERVLEEDDRVLDLLSYWQREFGSTKKGRAAPTFQFVYKLRLFFDIVDTDVAAIDLAYIQGVHDVTDSRYPCNEEDCLTLAALQSQEKFGDYSGTSPFKEDGLINFLPSKYLKGDREEELEQSIIKIYSKLKGYTTQEAKLNYLDYVKSWKIYGSAYFFVEPQNSRDFPSDVVLAINAKGILVVDPETKDFLAEYPYSEVVTWGHSAQTFVVVVGNLIRQTKIYFRSDQGVEMNSLVHAYVNKLLDRDQ
ncbi:hypothetical protein BASA81_000950 [Batrachochytrium salamandrivorans]|nr:hypothetical protein BASA81_000950 [Batrachochytrium salamandrivorans]